MLTKIKTPNQKNNLDKTASHPLQSQAWGEFRKAWGNEVYYSPFGLITFHRIPLRAGGPLGRRPFKIGMFIKGPRPTASMIKELKKLGKEKNLIFIKLEPNFVPKSNQQINQLTNLLRRNSAVPGKTLFTPTTFWIDLTKSEEELMASFHPKTRYNIRYAQKRGVEVVEDDSDKAFEIYLELTQETVERQGFYAHSRRYHELMWEYLSEKRKAKSEKPIAHLLTAKYQNQIITTWIVFVWKDFLYYPYGASSEKYKNVMANNLMMWEAIRFGKNLGLTTFDLWGREPGKGFTKFKEGYNPQVVEFLGTWDLVINKPLYCLYRAAELVRWPLLRIKSRFMKPIF